MCERVVGVGGCDRRAEELEELFAVEAAYVHDEAYGVGKQRKVLRFGTRRDHLSDHAANEK